MLSKVSQYNINLSVYFAGKLHHTVKQDFKDTINPDYCLLKNANFQSKKAMAK